MVISGLLSTVDSNLCAAASLTSDYGWGIREAKSAMLLLLALGIGIANIPGLTVTHLFLFYCTLRATTLLPTVMTLAGKRLTGTGVFAGIVTSFCIGLPVFAYGNLNNLSIWKTAGSLLTVFLSGAVALALSQKEART